MRRSGSEMAAQEDPEPPPTYIPNVQLHIEQFPLKKAWEWTAPQQRISTFRWIGNMEIQNATVGIENHEQI